MMFRSSQIRMLIVHNRIRSAGNSTGFQLRNPSIKEVLSCVRNGEIEMNAGFFPEEGKYNRTACSRCFTRYSPELAILNKWRCPADGGIIKKGVYDRARELTFGGIPSQRPPYLHIIPLGQIIQKVEGISSPLTKKGRSIYQRFISTFGNEIEVLINAPVTEMRAINAGTADAIEALRSGHVNLDPAGEESTGHSRSPDTCHDSHDQHPDFIVNIKETGRLHDQSMLKVHRDVCGYCGCCVSVCPEGALELIDAYLCVDKSCTSCGICAKVCPLGALEVPHEK